METKKTNGKIDLKNVLDWTITTIRYYRVHRLELSDQMEYLDKIIDFCEKEKEMF